MLSTDDLRRFCAANDLVKVRNGCRALTQHPDFRGQTIRALTINGLTALLKRVPRPAALPAVVSDVDAEQAMGAEWKRREATAARARAKAWGA